MNAIDRKNVKDALSRQGKQLADRAAWLQRMIEKAQQTIDNAQRTMDGWRDDLRATNVAVDALREQYRILIPDGDDESA